MLRVLKLEKRYPNGALALAGVDLHVAQGEILAIVGGSGCGKSTLLRLMSGLLAPSYGAIELDGAPVLGPRAEIGMAFQEPCLMPWLTLEANVGFGIRRLPEAERAARTTQALQRVGLAAQAGSWPKELSGGQAQRAALARALVARPKILLLDEPFSALDALTRVDLQDQLLELWSYERPTMILVTHDIEEAAVLGDRVVVMSANPGRISFELTPPVGRPRNRLDPEVSSFKRQLLEELGRAGDLRAFAPKQSETP